MVELEYWDEQRTATIARVSARELAMIPGAGDLVYIPAAEDPGVYRHLRITARHFYYSQEGALVSIRLHCDVL